MEHTSMGHRSHSHLWMHVSCIDMEICWNVWLTIQLFILYADNSQQSSSVSQLYQKESVHDQDLKWESKRFPKSLRKLGHHGAFGNCARTQETTQLLGITEEPDRKFKSGASIVNPVDKLVKKFSRSDRPSEYIFLPYMLAILDVFWPSTEKFQSAWDWKYCWRQYEDFQPNQWPHTKQFFDPELGGDYVGCSTSVVGWYPSISNKLAYSLQWVNLDFW